MIELKLTEQEAQSLINMMDLCLKVDGLKVAKHAINIVEKINLAVIELQKDNKD